MFFRNPLETPLDTNNIECQITNMYGDNEEDYYKIIIFGVTETGLSVGITIKDFCPFFYVCIPDSLQDSWNDASTKALKNYIKHRIYYKDSFVSCSTVQMKKLYPFTNFETFKFVKLVFSSTITFHVVKKLFYSSIRIPSISKREYIYELYENNIDPIMRFTQCADILTAGWISVSYDEAEAGNTVSQIDISTSWKNIKHLEKDTIAPIVIASFDIETFSHDSCYNNSNTFPNSANPEDTVSQIATTIWIYGTDNVYKHIVTLYDSSLPAISDASDASADEHIETALSEKELFEKWVSFICKVNPDGFTGYNIFGYDWKYLADRDKWNLLDQLSRINELPAELKHSELVSAAYGVNTFDILEMPGIFQIDLYTQIRRDHKLESYSLNNVALHFTKKQKNDMPYHEMFKKIKGTSEDILLVCKYCIQDTVLVVELIKQLKIITNLVEMAKVTRVPISWLITRGQQIKVFAQIAYSCSKKNVCVPFFSKKKVDTDKFVGATVLTANKGAYMTQAVAGLDFASLYPSIMIAHTLCYSTYVSNEPRYAKYKNLENVNYETVSWTIDNEDFSHTFVQGTDSILPDLLDTLWKCRKIAKKQMKNAHTENEKEVYNGKQLAIKVTMNSIYGFTGAVNGMLPLKAIAASTTTWGRKAIEHSKSLVEDAFDAEVCYGDSIPGYEHITVKSEQNEIYSIPISKLANKWIPYFNFVSDGSQKQQALAPKGTLAWTSSGWKPIIRVIRHKTNKKLYKISTNRGHVIVTEDHSLLTPDKLPVKPLSLKLGDKILHRPFFS